MCEMTFWYVEVESGGVESGDSTMAMPPGAIEVGTLDDLNAAIDSALDEQVRAFELEQNTVLLDVEKELAEIDPEPDNPEPILIRHQVFGGMDPGMLKKLNMAGIKTVEQMVELDADGLIGLQIKGLTGSKVEIWVVWAREILLRLR